MDERIFYTEKEEIEKTFRRSINAFFEMYPVI